MVFYCLCFETEHCVVIDQCKSNHVDVDTVRRYPYAFNEVL